MRSSTIRWNTKYAEGIVLPEVMSSRRQSESAFVRSLLMLFVTIATVQVYLQFSYH